MTLVEGWEPVEFVRDWWSVWSWRDGCSEWDRPHVSCKGDGESKRDGPSGNNEWSERDGASMAEKGYFFMHENYTNIFYLPSVCEIVWLFNHGISESRTP